MNRWRTQINQKYKKCNLCSFMKFNFHFMCIIWKLCLCSYTNTICPTLCLVGKLWGFLYGTFVYNVSRILFMQFEWRFWTAFTVSDHWLFSEDCSVQEFCLSAEEVMVCGKADGQEVYAVTHDIIPDKGWVMQFKVSVWSFMHSSSLLSSSPKWFHIWFNFQV